MQNQDVYNKTSFIDDAPILLAITDFFHYLDTIIYPSITKEDKEGSLVAEKNMSEAGFLKYTQMWYDGVLVSAMKQYGEYSVTSNIVDCETAMDFTFATSEFSFSLICKTHVEDGSYSNDPYKGKKGFFAIDEEDAIFPENLFFSDKIKQDFVVLQEVINKREDSKVFNAIRLMVNENFINIHDSYIEKKMLSGIMLETKTRNKKRI